MLVKHGLTTNRIGGFSFAHETRKKNFLKEGPNFLRNLLQEIGAEFEDREIRVEIQPLRGSGSVFFESATARFVLNEDPCVLDGVQLTYSVRKGAGYFAGRIPVVSLTQNVNSQNLLNSLREAVGQKN